MRRAFDRLLAVFDEELARFQDSRALRFLHSEAFGVEHYASVLREIYFYTRDSPQLQAAFTLSFQGEQRRAVRRMLGHAMDEIGHEELALGGLRALGIETEGLERENPLPSTLPILAHASYLLSRANPVGYLGQVFFLEFLPTRSGGALMDVLRSKGIPEEALEFLAEHAAVDVHHNRLMEHHIEALVRDEHDLEAVAYAIRCTAHLYAQMLEGAFAEPARGATLGRTVVEGRLEVLEVCRG